MSLFRPKRVVPNTLDPALCGLDWAAVPGLFRGRLSIKDAAFREEVRQAISQEVGVDWNSFGLDLDHGEDVSISNLQGEGAFEIAEAWADMGKMRRKLETLLEFLDGPERHVVERLLKKETPAEGSSQPADVWNEASGRSRNVEVHAGEPGKRVFQGRASISQTERAMARVSTGFEKPSPVLPVESDEETDDEDAEEARMRTAHYIFASYIGMDSQLPDPAATSSSPIQESTNDLRLATPISVKGDTLPLLTSIDPPFPATPAASPTRLPRSANAKCKGFNDTDVLPRTPPRFCATPLGSPLQLISPAPSTRKRRRSDRRVHQDDAVQPMLQVGGVPAVDFRSSAQQATSRLDDSRSPSNALKERAFKRRKLREDQDRPSVLGLSSERTCVPQDEAAVEPSKSSTSRVPKKTDPKGTSTTSLNMSRNSSRSRVSEDRLSRQSIRERIAQQLGQICPTLVRPSYSAKKTSDGAFWEVKFAQATQETEVMREFPEDLPSSESQASTDMEFDVVQSRKLAEELEAEYARGIRPGLAIPPLECIESQ